MKLGYEFKNKDLLKTALTHISLANEKNIESNQRLEFLGDSILSFTVAEYIYKKYPTLNEGRLTEIRAASVCEIALAKAARRLDLGSDIMFGKSEAVCGGKYKDSILADTFESVLGAIFLDSGIEEAKKWALTQLADTIEHSFNKDFRNYKSEIQNYFQKRDKGTEVVTYRLVSKSGPDHAPTFTTEAIYRGRIIGRGTAGSRKEAEQHAAKDAYLKL